jgi:hypothetical protein
VAESVGRFGTGRGDEKMSKREIATMLIVFVIATWMTDLQGGVISAAIYAAIALFTDSK